MSDDNGSSAGAGGNGSRDLFRGAHRATRYAEQDPGVLVVDEVGAGPAAADAAAPGRAAATGRSRPVAPATEPVPAAPVSTLGEGLGLLTQALRGSSPTSHPDTGVRVAERWDTLPARRAPRGLVAAPVREHPAQWGWRGVLGRGTGGLIKLRPEKDELEHRAAITNIRRATWQRAVNIVVTNPKGGVGKTPAALLLAGILGHVRGGYVVAWEAAESVGTLTRRAEGEPSRGLAELLTSAGQVHSAGQLGGYTAPQTSHADVVGSVGARRTLTAADVLAARQVLDTYYRITVTDTGNNPGHGAFLAALRTADAAVIPCLVSIDALAGLEEVLAVMRADGGQVAAGDGLQSRVVVVLGHDGGPEDDQITTALRARLDELGVHAVVEVPFDPAIRLGGEITLSELSEASTRAWTAAASQVVTALSSAPTHLDLVQQLQSTPTADRS